MPNFDEKRLAYSLAFWLKRVPPETPFLDEKGKPMALKFFSKEITSKNAKFW